MGRWKKGSFFLNGPALKPPPPSTWMARPLREDLFCGFPKGDSSNFILYPPIIRFGDKSECEKLLIFIYFSGFVDRFFVLPHRNCVSKVSMNRKKCEKCILFYVQDFIYCVKTTFCDSKYLLIRIYYFTHYYKYKKNLD